MTHLNGTQSTPDDCLRVTVVGAGLSGLACAVSLRRQGHLVEIFERSQFLAEVGAAISMPRNVTRIMKVLGAKPENLRPTELKMIHMYAHDKAEPPTNVIPVAPVRGKNDFPTYQLHRVDLHNELKRLATSIDGGGTPCRLHLKAPVIDCDPSTASITLSDGRQIAADLLIVADGVKSELRKKILGPNNVPTPSGFSCYRWVLPMDPFLSDPKAAWLIEDMNTVRIPTDGKHRRIVFYPCRDSTLLNVAAIYDDRTNQTTEIDPQATVPIQQALETFSDFHERYLHILRQSGRAKVWPLLKLDSYDTWVNGRTCLVGDAAHSMLPHVAQGGAQCIEDAGSMGELFPMGTRRSDINGRLKLFEEVRKPRCTGFQSIAYRTAEGLPVKWNSDMNQKGYYHMAFDYDAMEVAREALHRSMTL